MTWARALLPDREQREAARSARMGAMADQVRQSPRSSATGGGGTTGAAIAKEEIVRSEPYRRLIASLPCIRCGVWGYSQAAHPPPTAKGRKESDLECFPLCAARAGKMGCHQAFDQYILFPAREMRAQAQCWAKETQRKLRADGSWPMKKETTA